MTVDVYLQETAARRSCANFHRLKVAATWGSLTEKAKESVALGGDPISPKAGKKRLTV